MELFWLTSAAVVFLIVCVTLILNSVHLCSPLRYGVYDYLLLNITAGTSEEALLEHLRLTLHGKLNDDGFLFARTTARFSCNKKLDLDDWDNCESYGGRSLVLVQKVSNKLECSDRFSGRTPNGTHIQSKVKRIPYTDVNGKPFYRLQLSGPLTELCVILDQLLHSDQVFNRQDVARTTSFSTQDEVTKPLIERNNRADKHAKREEKYPDVAPQDARPDCDSNKTESLAIEGDLYDYALKYRRDKMESILHPKPFSSEFRSGTLILVGQACLVSKAAEGVAVICQKLTKDLSRVIFKLSEGINREAFTREAESRVAVPNRTLLLNNGSDNTFTLYGPRDKVEEVREGLKYLESQLLGSPESRVLARPKSGSVTPNFQADQRKLTLFPEQVEPRRGFYAGPANGSKMEPKQPSTFVKVESKREPTEPVYQQRPYGEASNNAIHPRTPGNQIAVSVLKGDLREQRTNVIVNPSNTQLLHRAGAAKAIADAAGPRLVYECEDYIRGHGELKTGQVMHTTAGNLSPQIQYVIHAAGPSASAYPEKRDLARKLEETFFNCLKYANDKLRVKSIAIPAISSGIYGAPKELVACAAHDALKKFEQAATGGAMTLEKVNFVNIDDESTYAFNEVFKGERRPCRASEDMDQVRAENAERDKPRSKSADQPKRKRELKKASSSTFNGSANGLSNGATTATVANGDESGDCVICMETMTSPKTLPCGHKFCEECIKDYFEQGQPKCPSCGRLFGVMRGNQPPGKMRVNTSPVSLTGYERYKTILVEYDIPNGVQNDSHPNPGIPYSGTHRTAFLPDSPEGREVCDLLRKAFDAGLVFTVGRSTTTGKDNQVIWNDIHHKTSDTGQYGYPDAGYLSRVKDELKAKGIVSDADEHKLKQTAI